VLQPRVVDAREILLQHGVGGRVSSSNGRAKVSAHLAEEAEATLLTVIFPKPVDFRGNGEYGEFIGMVQRQCKAQDRQMPCPYQPRMPSIRFIMRFCVSHE
jgi:hypothetical protein